jgi:hypothetical protein
MSQKTVRSLERRIRQAIDRYTELTEERLSLVEFDGKPLTAKKLRTRCRCARTQSINALEQTTQAYDYHLLSEEVAKGMLKPMLANLEAIVDRPRRVISPGP